MFWVSHPRLSPRLRSNTSISDKAEARTDDAFGLMGEAGDRMIRSPAFLLENKRFPKIINQARKYQEGIYRPLPRPVHARPGLTRLAAVPEHPCPGLTRPILNRSG
ncbi:protein of unknown function [Methylocaldum szegediense]|uniref:Uncharacterized protein n=1 Tax=Methylocaldum szegediense TaxID=73780 RepID=A0ABN8X8G0_9GAMM|nr:protein of unknown function [Methylocaldum szegediense]